jgi:hypothetical protein
MRVSPGAIISLRSERKFHIISLRSERKFQPLSGLPFCEIIYLKHYMHSPIWRMASFAICYYRRFARYISCQNSLHEVN